MTVKKWIVSLLAAALVAGSLVGCGVKRDRAEAYADQACTTAALPTKPPQKWPPEPWP